MAGYLKQQTDCNRLKEKVANQGESLRVGTSRFYNPFSTKWKPCHGAVNNRPRKLRIALQRYFRFHSNCKQYALKRRMLCHKLKFVFHFSQKLHIQFWKHFYSVLLCSVGSDYCKKSRVLDFLANVFLPGCFSAFNKVATYFFSHF